MSTIRTVEGLEALPQDSVIRVPTNGDVLVRCGAYWFCVGSEETWASASLDKDLPAETLHPRTVGKAEVDAVIAALDDVDDAHDFESGDFPSSTEYAHAALAAMGIPVVEHV